MNSLVRRGLHYSLPDLRRRGFCATRSCRRRKGVAFVWHRWLADRTYLSITIYHHVCTDCWLVSYLRSTADRCRTQGRFRLPGRLIPLSVIRFIELLESGTEEQLIAADFPPC